MPKYASAVITTARNQIGYHEKASNYNLDDYTANSGSGNYNKFAHYIDTNYPTFYNGRKNGYAWCDIFVDYCFLYTYGLDTTLYLLCQPLNSAGAGCTYSYMYYNQKGRVGKTPKVGAQIFFGYSQDNLTHTGIVENFDETYVYTIEGNTSDQVARRTYRRDYSRIYGYGYPDYDEEGSGGNTTPDNPAAEGGLNDDYTTTPTTTPFTDTTPPVVTIFDNISETLTKAIGAFAYVNQNNAPCRTWYSDTAPQLKSHPTLNKNTRIGLCSRHKDSAGNHWYYFKYSGVFGFIKDCYVYDGVSTTSTPTTSAQPTQQQNTPATNNTQTETTTTTTETAPAAKPTSTTGNVSKVIPANLNSWGTYNTKRVFNKTCVFYGKVAATTLNVRTWAGTNNSRLKSVPEIRGGKVIEVLDWLRANDGEVWYYIRINGSIYGFVYAKYIQKVG